MGTLPIKVETGRYTGTPRAERLCLSCDQHAVEDEGHILFHCKKYSDIRKTFYLEVLMNEDDNIITKYKNILATDNPSIMFSTANYLHNALTLRCKSAS